MATNYIWQFADDSYLMEKDDFGNTAALYISEPVLYGKPIYQVKSGQANYYHFDGNGSTTELTSALGAISDSRRYTAFGEVISQTGTTVFAFQFVGQAGYYQDANLDSYNVRRRQLSVKFGRWLSEDPLIYDLKSLQDFDQARNGYIYVENSPLSNIDPNGEDLIRCCGRCGDEFVKFAIIDKDIKIAGPKCPDLSTLEGWALKDIQDQLLDACEEDHQLKPSSSKLKCKPNCFCENVVREEFTKEFTRLCKIDFMFVIFLFPMKRVEVFFPPDIPDPGQGPCEAIVQLKVEKIVQRNEGTCE